MFLLFIYFGGTVQHIYIEREFMSFQLEFLANALILFYSSLFATAAVKFHGKNTEKRLTAGDNGYKISVSMDDFVYPVYCSAIFS